MATNDKEFGEYKVTGWNDVTLADLDGLPTIPSNATLTDVEVTCGIHRDGGVTASDAKTWFRLNGSTASSDELKKNENVGHGTTPYKFSIMSHITNNNGVLSYSSGATFIRIVVAHRKNIITGAATWTLNAGAKITAYYTEHSHSYTATVTKDATCTTAGETTYTCSCGEGSYTDTTIPAALGHNYKEEIIPPTVSSHGYTRYTCTRCGDTYETDIAYPVRIGKQSVVGVYIVPTARNIAYVVADDVVSVEAGSKTIDGWSFTVLNSIPENGYLLEKLYINNDRIY